jgi:hypothetical protein
MAKYSETAQKEVEKQMSERKRGKGRAKSKKQAIAIGLNKARRKGAKVPAKKS